MTPDGPTDESANGRVVLGGKYELGDVLGTGGTYTVYEASAVEGGAEPLVIKVLHPHLVDDATTRAALAREIAASDQIDHPSVVKVLDSGEDELAGATVPWVLTRRLPGTLLADAVSGSGLPWPEALAVVDGLLTALGAVHAAGLVHRDVGARNVVVDRHDDGTVSVGLLDLGLTAPGGGDGDGETVVGSVATMSPEQALGRPLDARSDLYSVGALCYFALTGHAPYERPRAEDVLRAHVGAPVPAPSARQGTVPVSVDRFVARAMAKDPADRYASAAEMAAAAGALVAAAAAAGGGGDPDQTMTLGQIAADDPDRTAVVGAAGAAAAGVAAAMAAAELQRTRQLGAVDDAEATAVVAGGGAAAEGAATPDGLPQDGAEDPTVAGAAAPPADTAAGTSRWRAFLRHPLTVAALTLLLAAGAVGAFLLWNDDGADETPVAPASRSASPSPSPSPTSSPSSRPTQEPTSRPTRTTSPTPTPSASPSDEPSEEPTTEPTVEPTPSEEPTTEPTEEPTTEPTEEPTAEPTQDPEPTEEPTTGATDPADPAEPSAGATAPAGSGGSGGSAASGGADAGAA